MQTTLLLDSNLLLLLVLGSFDIRLVASFKRLSVRLPWLDYFASVVASMDEEYLASSELAMTELFTLCGITDSAIASLPKGTVLVTYH